MRQYRIQPPRAKRLRSDDAWAEDWNLMDRSITVYESEPAWEQIGILAPDGQPIEALSGGIEPIGFLWQFHEDN